MRDHEIKKELQRTLSKLAKKDRNSYEQIMGKIERGEECLSPRHHKARDQSRGHKEQSGVNCDF